MDQRLPLPRKWRPRTFDALVGQEAVSQTLEHAIKENRVAHAYLFTGPRGVGKTTTARLLAACLNCEKGPTITPCGACPSCREIASRGESLDTIELDAASNNSVEDARSLIEILRYAPQRDRYRVLILDEVHMLSKAAFNALLKTIEEPPAHAVFVLASTELHKIPATIISRCQRFSFRRVSDDEIAKHLRKIAEAEKLDATDGALATIARAADGSLRDALSLLDQAATISGGKIDEKRCTEIFAFVDESVLASLADAVFRGDRVEVLRAVAKARDDGADARHVASEFVRHLKGRLERGASEPDADPGYDALLRAMSLAIATDRQLTRASDAWLVWEMSLLTMAELPRLVRIEDAIESLSSPPGPRESARPAAPAGTSARTSAAVPTVRPDDPAARFRAIVGAGRVTVASYLSLARSVSSDGRKLSITFSLEHDSARDFLQRTESLAVLAAAAKEAFGTALEIELNVESAPEAGGPVPSPPSESVPRSARKTGKAEEDPLVRRAMDLFRGEVVDVKDER